MHGSIDTHVVCGRRVAMFQSYAILYTVTGVLLLKSYTQIVILSTTVRTTHYSTKQLLVYCTVLLGRNRDAGPSWISYFLLRGKSVFYTKLNSVLLKGPSPEKYVYQPYEYNKKVRAC